MSFATLQADFARRLHQPDATAPAGIAGPEARRRRGFAIYRNNVAVGLQGALAARYPAVERIVGADCFAALAALFIAREPPASPALLAYGAAFPAFLAGVPELAGLPYLADVARIESARVEAYHAADLPVCGPHALAGAAPSDLPRVRMALHPAVHVVRSVHPAVSIWATNSRAGEVPPIADWRPEDALVARPEGAPFVCRIAPGTAAFLQALAAERPLGAALEAAGAAEPARDPAAAIADAFALRLVAAVTRTPLTEVS